MFCVEGYVLGPNGCMLDPDRDLDIHSTTVYPEKLLVELTVSHKMCLFIEDTNETAKCLHPFLVDLAMDEETGDWTRRFADEFLAKLSKKLCVDSNRIQNFEVINRETSSKVVTSIIEDFHDNNDDFQVNENNLR